MTRRRRNTGPVTVEQFRKPYDVDTSWMKKETCHWCGKEYIVNNYADRKVRRMKLFNRYICSYCKHHVRGVKFLFELIQLVKDVAEVPCLQSYEGRKAKKQRKCTCLPCRARRLVDGEERQETKGEGSEVQG